MSAEVKEIVVEWQGGWKFEGKNQSGGQVLMGGKDDAWRVAPGWMWPVSWRKPQKYVLPTGFLIPSMKLKDIIAFESLLQKPRAREEWGSVGCERSSHPTDPLTPRQITFCSRVNRIMK